MAKILSHGFLFGKYSHNDPKKELIVHLEGVLNIAEEIKKFHGLSVDVENVALMHDVAKSHKDFQNYLLNNGRRFNHSEPSSLFLLNETKNFMEAEIVRRHHTGILDLSDIKLFWNSSEVQENFSKRIKEFAGNDFETISKEELRYLAYKFFREKYGIEEWLDFKTVYSILITADRLDASNSEKIDFKKPEFDLNKLNEHISTLPKNGLSEWRESVRETTLEEVEKKVDKPGVYTLTLPTGAGKTITGFQAASLISEKFDLKTIIYVLPFISIVEQNTIVAKQMFDEVQEDHYLVNALKDTEKMTNLEKFISFFRYWSSPVVVTTLAKFWEVLYSPKANDTMNFHRLADAIVILDEPQSLDSKFWAGFGRTIDFLSKEYGTFFILMTATQPEIAKGPEIAPPVKMPRSRHSYKIVEGKKKIEDIEDILDFNGSGLMVFNTKKSAFAAYEKYRQRLNGEVFFLSAWMIPAERRKKVKEMKKLETYGKPRSLVSTQVVEAGVDLDFEWVFRDIGPLDSIVQVAGRCNRNMRRESGTVTVAEIVDENGKPFAPSVYGKVLLSKTEETLLGLKEFSESDIPEILSKYYRKVSSSISQEGPWYRIKKGEWGYYEPLIEERNEALVFVDIDGEVEKLFERFRDMNRTLENLEERKRMWKELRDYAINVSQNYMEAWKRKSGGIMIDDFEPELQELQYRMWIVRKNAIGKIYRMDCGFVPPEEEEHLDD